MEQRDRRARVAVATAYFVQGLCFAALLTQTPALQQRFELTDGELTLILLAVPVVAGLGSVLAGVLASRTGSSTVLRAGNLLVCLSIAAAGAAGSLPLLFAAVAAAGLGLGLVDASMNMQGVAIEHRYGRPVLGSLHAVWSAGAIAGALATYGAALLDWSLAAALGGVAMLGAVAALAAGPSLLHGVERRSAGNEAVVTLPWRPIILVGLAMTLVFVADSAASNWSAVYLSRFADGADRAALGLAAYQACTLLGRAFTDRLSVALGSVRTVGLGAVVGAAGLFVVAAAREPWTAVAGFAVLGLGICVVVPQSFSAAGRLDPDGTGVVVARVNLFNYLGFVVGAALVGAVAEAASLRLAFAVPAVLCLGIVALAPAFGRTAARPVTTAAP
jgi:MFS family permease